MSNNVKRLFFVTTLVLLLFAIAAVSASDVSDDAALPGDSSVSVSAADSLVNDNNIVTDTVTRENNNKQEKTNIKKATLDTPKTVVVTSTNYSDVFTNTGLCSDVNDGDVIDVQSDITTNNFNITIDKAINLTTTTGAIINLNTTGGNLFGTNPGNSFKIVNSGSYTNVTNLKFYNTQVFVINAHHVTMDNINVTVNNQVVGSGVGVTSIRDNSTYVTVKNSNFYTKNNGGSSSVVLAWADYCTIDNNNITGEGNVGNLMYLTTYNINGTPEYAVDINMYNNITNNNITAVSVTGPCVGVVVTGHDNKFENNKVNVSSSFAGQWMSPTLNETGDHDDRWEGNNYINNEVYGSFTGTKNSTICGNTFHGSVSLPERCIFKNNNAENSTVTIRGSYCDLCGNRINTLSLVGSVYPTYVCRDNYFVNQPSNTNIYWYNHGAPHVVLDLDATMLNKKHLHSIKSDGSEVTVATITDDETFFQWFDNQGRIKSDVINTNMVYNLYYVPSDITLLGFDIMGPDWQKGMLYNFTVVGKKDVEFKNILVSASVNCIVFSNLTFVYDEEYTQSQIFNVQPGDENGNIIFDNIVINVTTDSINLKTIFYSISYAGNVTLQNSVINAKVPSSDADNRYYGFEAVCMYIKNSKIINNTINLEEEFAVSDNSKMVGIGLHFMNSYYHANNTLIEGNNINIQGTNAYGIKINQTGNNSIKDNEINVMGEVAEAIEVNGNDNTVTGNTLYANNLAGDAAVVDNGENNVVNGNSPTIADIVDDETFFQWFDNQGRIKSDVINTNMVYNLYYVPSDITLLGFDIMGPDWQKGMLYNFTVVGKKDVEFKNILVSASVNCIVFSNLTFVYDEEYTQSQIFNVQPGDENGNIIFDNIVINVTTDSINLKTIFYSISYAGNVTLQNSVINAKVPSSDADNRYYGFEAVCMYIKNSKIINNTINLEEEFAVSDNSKMVGIGLHFMNSYYHANNTLIEGNNINIQGTNAYGIKINQTGNNSIKDNEINVMGEVAEAIEVNGNDNTVTDNYIVANDKKGDNAVTVTGENNVVENNRAPEGGNLIPTSIGLTYDTTPIDVGQRLIIRGVFKADGVESSAQGIKVYDNDEFIATINTSDEYGTLTYGYTPTVGGSHNVKFVFEGNDTHNATSTVIIVETTTQLLSPVVNITTDNFYDYFNSEGELDYQMLTDDTTFYFYSIPGDVSQISYTRLSNDVKDKNVTFAGTEDFVLTDTAIIIKSTTNNFRLVNMTLVYTDEYQQHDYILFDKTGTEAYIDNCNITANITRTTFEGYPYSVISTARSPVVISNSKIYVDAVETVVDWEPNSPNYGNNNVIPILSKSKISLVNNTIEIHAVCDETEYPTIYCIRLGGDASVMTDNNVTVTGEGWLYAIQPTANNVIVSNNNINITGVNYTAGIMMENISNNTIDNNTIVLNARTSREGMSNEPCTYGITVIDYICGGTAYHETGNAVNNKITNNIITCTAYNMYGIEEFGGSNTTIENNTIVATGDTAMAIGVTGVNVLINNNNITVDGASFSGTTVDYLGARTTGVYLGRGTNATVTNNNISSTYTGVYALAQNITTIEDNNITTDYNYTILLDSTTQYAIVENNYLETPGRLGDESVSDSGKDNTVENNLPAVEKEYSLVVDTTEFVPGSTATISASIYYGTEYTSDVAANISKGKVSFKVNGKTLKDVNGKVIYAKVVNGTATIEDYQIPDNWNNQTTIQAVYSGSKDLAKMSSDKTAITIVAQNPTITTEDVTTTVGGTVTLTATINTDAVVNTGKVVFKINGKTVKDANGKVIYTKVSNNQVSLEYTLPETMNEGTYTLTAVFISSDYDRLEDTKTLTVN